MLSPDSLQSYICKAMSKRDNSKLSPPAPKKVCKSAAGDTRQSSLLKFFTSPQAGESSRSTRPHFADNTPQYFGVHLYSAQDISDSCGLEKNYKEHWNKNAVAICKDEAVRKKLKDKTAIHGAINTRWTLHKSMLLNLQVEELVIRASQIHSDEISLQCEVSTMKSNRVKVMELTEQIVVLKGTDTQEDQEEEATEMMKELRRLQSNLKKAIDTKKQELENFKSAQLLTATETEELPPEEFQEILTEMLGESDQIPCDN